LRDNFGFVMQGVGVVVPIFATYDSHPKPEARLYFYDAMGAQFEATDYAATGSGSPAVRGILFYENNWGAKPLQELGEDEAVSIALRALDTASQSEDRKSTRLNSSHDQISALSLHDALPI